MAPAILTGLFILLLYSQGTSSQQSLNTNLNLGLSSAVNLQQQPIQRSTNSNLNQIPTTSLSFNSPQPTNVQQLQTQSFNLQQPNVQQTCNLQPQLNSQSLSPSTSSQSFRQQNQFQNGESSFASFANTRFSGLNSQAAQGTPSSSPSVSPAPSLQITSCSFKPSVELTSAGQSQNQFGNMFTIPASVINKSPVSNGPSVSTSVMESLKYQPTFTFQTVSTPTQKSIQPNHQTMTLNLVPTAQSQFTDTKNQINFQPEAYYTQSPALNSIQNQPLVTSAQSQPTTFTIENPPDLPSEQNQHTVFNVQGPTGLSSVQNQQTIYTVQSQPSTTSAQNQPAFFTVQGQPVLTSLQSQPILTSVQSQPVVYNMGQGQSTLIPAEIQPIATSVQGQPAIASLESQMPLVSVLMSQLLSSSSNPYGKVSLPNPVVETKQGSKSSGLKALLPLLFNLFKEKSSGCGCRRCGCMNNNYYNSNQNFSNEPKEPQICGGYSNQKNYSHQHLTNEEILKKQNDETEELDSSEDWKQERQNNKYNITYLDSTETSEEDDAEYADDDDDDDNGD